MMFKIFLAFITAIVTASACQFLHPVDIKNELKPNTLYSKLGPFVAHKDALIMLYVGNSTGPKGKAFRERLKKHVDLVAENMKPKGKMGYLIYATDDQELALVQYPSEEAMKKAFNEKGKVVRSDSSQFLEMKVWEKLENTQYPITESWVKVQLKRGQK